MGCFTHHLLTKTIYYIKKHTLEVTFAANFKIYNDYI